MPLPDAGSFFTRKPGSSLRRKQHVHAQAMARAPARSFASPRSSSSCVAAHRTAAGSTSVISIMSTPTINQHPSAEMINVKARSRMHDRHRKQKCAESYHRQDCADRVEHLPSVTKQCPIEGQVVSSPAVNPLVDGIDPDCPDSNHRGVGQSGHSHQPTTVQRPPRGRRQERESLQRANGRTVP